MKKIISDILVCDPLPDGRPSKYDFGPSSNICYLNSNGNVEVLGKTRLSTQIYIPLLKMDGEWNFLYRNEANNLKSGITKLLLKTASLSPNNIEFNNIVIIENIILMAQAVLSSLTAIENALNHILCSKKFFDDNYEQLCELNYDRFFLPLEELDINKLIAFPDPEFVGVLVVQGNNFGAGAISNNILNITLG